MNEAMAAVAWSVGCTCSDFQARVSLRLSPIQVQGLLSQAPQVQHSVLAIQGKGSVSPSPSFTMPYVMGPGENDSPSSVIFCMLFRTCYPVVGGLWPCTHKPLTFDPSEYMHFYYLCILWFIFLPLPP